MIEIDWSGVADCDDPAAECPTLLEYGAIWIARRRSRGLRSVGDDAQRLATYVIPALGEIRLDQISTKMVSRWLSRVCETDLAPRTKRAIYRVLAGLMRSAALDGWIEAVPTMHSSQLPPATDADPERLARAPFSALEVSTLISSPEIPIQRRVVYALGALAGLRIGEIGGLNWADLDTTRRPLSSLLIVRQYDPRSKSLRETKTKTPRLVPVHPRLALVLARWRSEYAAAAGTMPTGSAALVLTRLGSRWSSWSAKQALERDCSRLEISRHTPHNLRTTFATLARNAANGERREVIEQITHTKKRDVIEMYTVTNYETLCRAVSAIEIADSSRLISIS